MKKTFLFFLILAGCGTLGLKSDSRKLLEPTGCPLKTIRVEKLQHDGPGDRWKAFCGGRVFLCKRAYGQRSCEEQ